MTTARAATPSSNLLGYPTPLPLRSEGRAGPLGPPEFSSGLSAFRRFRRGQRPRPTGAAAPLRLAIWLVLLASNASAHSRELSAAVSAAPVTVRSWSFEPGVVLPLALSAFLYARGLRRLRRATQAPRKLHRAALAFLAGWLCLVAALVSPLHPWGAELFSAHMTQHELLMIAAAPLLILGRPGLVFLWAFSARAAREFILWHRALGTERLWSQLTRPFVAWTVHLLALWVWHIPALFQSTLHSELAHAAQHTTFLVGALIFWHAVFHGPHRQFGYSLAVLNLFATALQTGALGALIAFAHHPWYPAYAASTAVWGLTPLEDQQLGGLIMWIPAGFAYVIAGLCLAARALRAPQAAPHSTLRRLSPRPAR